MHLHPIETLSDTVKKVHWDWTVTFGNILSITAMVCGFGLSAFGLYMRYESRLISMEGQIGEQNKTMAALAKQMEAHAASMVNLRTEQGDTEKKRVSELAAIDQRRMSENVSYAQYVKGMDEAGADRRRIEARIEASAQEFKSGVSDIKQLIRDQTRVEEQRFLAVQQRMDALRDQRDVSGTVPRR